MKFVLLPFTFAALLPTRILGLDPGEKKCASCDEVPENLESASGSFTKIMECAEKYESLESDVEVIDKFEIFAVGDEILNTCAETLEGDSGYTSYPKPIGKINSLEPFYGETYFEISIDQLPIITDPDSDIELVFSVWANGGEGDCDKLGLETKLAETYVTTEISQFTAVAYNSNYDQSIEAIVAAYNDPDGALQKIVESTSVFPYLLNSDIVQGTFMFTEAGQTSLFGEGDEGLGLYFTDPDAPSETGKLKLCTRAEYKVDYSTGEGKETVSVLDTNYVIEIDLTAAFSTFSSTDVTIFKRNPTDINTEVSASIEVDAYVCDSENQSVASVKFTDGQDFRICVAPKNEDTAVFTYAIESFDTITCSNSVESRQLVTLGGIADALTTIDVPNADGSLGFTSVVTSGFLALDGEGSVPANFACTGDVKLSAVNADSRRVRGLTAKIDFSSLTKTSSSYERKMQDNEAPTAAEDAPFAVAIELADPTAESSSPSYGPLLGLYYIAVGAVAALL